MTLASTVPETYRLHLYVYGKVIQGNRDHRGQIKPGADHRMTGRSAGFPDDLQPYCAPDRFVAHWNGSNTVDGRQMPGGAFLYRPVRVSGRLYGLFARIQSRSELGEGMPGRAYSHCAVLAVEDRWEPALIPAMAEFLFDERQTCLGVPNFEGQKNRLDLPVEPVRRDAVQALAAAPNDAGTHQAVVLGRELAKTLTEESLGFHGRWLPFALGAKQGVSGPFGQFSAVTDRIDTLRFIEPHFTDKDPPLAVVQGELNGEINASRFEQGLTARRNFSSRLLLLQSSNYWPDQGVAAEVEPEPLVEGLWDIEKNVAAVVRPESDDGHWLGPEGISEAKQILSENSTFGLYAPPRVAGPGQTLAVFLRSIRFRNPSHSVYVSKVSIENIQGAVHYLHDRLKDVQRSVALGGLFVESREQTLENHDKVLSDAIETALGLSLRMAVQGEMTEYSTLLGRDVLAMPGIPDLELSESSFGSPFAYLVFILKSKLDETEPAHQGAMMPLWRWFFQIGFPSTGMSPKGKQMVDEAHDRFDRFADQVLRPPDEQAYSDASMLGHYFEPWWRVLHDHAQDYPSWLFEPTPPPRR